MLQSMRSSLLQLTGASPSGSTSSASMPAEASTQTVEPQPDLEVGASFDSIAYSDDTLKKMYHLKGD